jgi:hypothetical protein
MSSPFTATADPKPSFPLENTNKKSFKQPPYHTTPRKPITNETHSLFGDSQSNIFFAATTSNQPTTAI